MSILYWEVSLIGNAVVINDIIVGSNPTFPIILVGSDANDIKR